MLIVFAQLLTVESRTVCRQTRNTKVTKDEETIVTTWTTTNPPVSPRSPRLDNKQQHVQRQQQSHLCRRRPQPRSTTVARTPHPHFTFLVRRGFSYAFFLVVVVVFFFLFFFVSLSRFSHVSTRDSFLSPPSFVLEKKEGIYRRNIPKYRRVTDVRSALFRAACSSGRVVPIDGRR